jgi:N-acetylneuraminate synthase/N,N'-diacetyllegionaminate synthase
MIFSKKKFSIGDRDIGANNPPYCIAEVGINHNGSLDLAKKMIDIAKVAGADAVKFQTFKAEEFCGDSNQIFKYRSQGKEIEEPMLDMFKRYELSPENWNKIKEYSDKIGISFFSTPQNISDLNFLQTIGVPVIKIGSDDFTNLPLIRKYKETNLPIILSCGMSDLSEVHQALEAVSWFDDYPAALLLCTSQYPTPPEDVNILKLNTLQSSFPGLITGFSDHTQGFLAASLAVSLGARIFEKHFTLDKNLPGPDHWFSEEAKGLSEWVKNIHIADKMLGSSIVKPTKAELMNKKEFQRVIVASTQINSGDNFTEQNLEMKRVSGGEGMNANMYSYLLGQKAWRHFKKLEPIKI